MTARIVAVFGLVSLASCAHTVDKQAEGEALMQRSREWSRAAEAGDAERVLAVWTDDAVVLPPDAPALRGEQIRQFVEGAFQTPGFSIGWEPISAHIADSGEMGYLIERTTVTMPDPSGTPVTVEGKALTVWRKEDGVWRCAADIWNDGPQ